jgi:hypothetical protein
MPLADDTLSTQISLPPSETGDASVRRAIWSVPE